MYAIFVLSIERESAPEEAKGRFGLLCGYKIWSLHIFVVLGMDLHLFVLVYAQLNDIFPSWTLCNITRRSSLCPSFCLLF